MVAESTEILRPIDQFGCATACAGVACAICAALDVRNALQLANVALPTGKLVRENREIARFRRETGRSVAEAGDFGLPNHVLGRAPRERRVTRGHPVGRGPAAGARSR